MDLREETISIFKNTFGTEAAYKVLEFIESRIPADIATSKDIYELKLEIEKVRAEVEKVRADLSKDIEKVRADVLKWSFAFWISQMALLAGILFKVLS
jgi:putative NADPH-quinone reductase